MLNMISPFNISFKPCVCVSFEKLLNILKDFDLDGRGKV